jgi:hypothetical protein
LSLQVRATVWDRAIFVRSAGVATLAVGLAWILTVTTDEGGVSWGERAGRALPLAPLCAAVGVWGALAPIRARGEAIALGALGRTRGEIAASAVAGGATIALIMALAIWTVSAVSLDGFYPTARHADEWRWEGDAFVDPMQHLRVGKDGEPVRTPGAGSQVPSITPIPAARAAAGLYTAMAGMGTALWCAHAMLAPLGRATMCGAPIPRSAIAAVSISAVATIFLFQAAAAQLIPALVATIPPLMLLVTAVARYRLTP